MALPNPGSSISLSQINTELGRSSTATVSLNTAEDGGYVPINLCSQFKPRAANPAKFSEWYKYNHTAPCNLCYNGSNAITQSFSVPSGNPYSQYYYFPIAFSTIGESSITLILSSLSNSTNCAVYCGFGAYYLSTNDFYTFSYGGTISLSDPSNGTYTSYGTGALTHDWTGTDGIYYIILQVYNGSASTFSGNAEIRFSCPTITSCGNSYTTFADNCGNNGSNWHWMDAGTTSRNITLTYSLSGFNNTNATLYIKDDDDNVVVNGATVSQGTNQTYTFYFNYVGFRYLKIMFYDSYSC